MIKWDGELIAFVSDPANAPENLYPTGEYIDYTALPSADVSARKTTSATSAFSLKTLGIIGLGVLGLVLVLRSR